MLDRILEDMLAAVLVGGVLTAVLSYLAPQTADREAIEVVAAKDRGLRLQTARDVTREWWFSGGMGRYTRAETLPALADKCRDDGLSRTVVIQILDPRSTELCRHYAELRRSVRSGANTDWTPGRVRNEVLSTILTAYAIRTEQPRLDLRIGLRNSVSQQRYDLSDKEVLITTEDLRREALAYLSGSSFYDAIREDLRWSLSQAQSLPSDVTVLRAEFDSDALDSALVNLGLDSMDLDAAAKAQVIKLVRGE